MRQQDADYRAAAQMLSEGRTLDGFNALDKKEWVKEIGDDETRYQAMAAEYLQAVKDGKSCLVVSPTHAEAKSITAEIRGQLREAGKLGPEDRELTRLVAVNASEAERGQVTTYRKDDVIQFHQNGKGKFIKGMRFTVSDPANVPVAEAAKFSLYRKEKAALAEGDKIRFTGNVQDYHGEHTYKNGDTITVKAFTPGGNIRGDDGRIIAADAGHWRHAFVETSFGAQGQTVKRVILGMSSESLGATNMEQLYVSATRGKENLSLFTDSKELVKQAIQRSSQKVAALDIGPKPAEPKRSRLIADHLERMHRLSSVKRQRPARGFSPVPPHPSRPGPGGGRPLPPTHRERVIVEQQERRASHGR